MKLASWSLAVVAVLALLGSSVSQADTIGYWRFGDDPGGFLADSGPNGLDLTADVSPILTAVPATGVGSEFDAIAGNSNFAGFPSALVGTSGGVSAPHVADSAAFVVTDFTVELLVNLEETDFENTTAFPQWHLAAQYGFGNIAPPAAANRSWSLSVEVDPAGNAGLGLSGGELFMLADEDGNSPFSTIGSDIILQNGVDYAVAMTYDSVNGETKFYATDLATGISQISTVVHGLGVLNDSPRDFTIGSLTPTSQSRFEMAGAIDDVRLSNVILSGSELLVPVPEPASMALLGLGACSMLLARRRRG